MGMESLFIQLAAIVIASALLGLLARSLRQPLVLAYIASGIVLGPSLLGIVSPGGSLALFSEVGIAFLLFLVGLSMRTRVFREIGKVALVTAAAQMAVTTAAGLLLALTLGFSLFESLFLAIAFSFSSTIIVVKLLTDKKDLDSLYGRISVGILLIQDFIAIAVLVLVSGLFAGGTLEAFAITTALKVAVLLAIPLFFNRFFLSPVFSHISKNHELLFLSGIAWCFIMALASFLLGFSIEIGAFLAGVSLASIPFNYHISVQIRPLRDFFLIIFFVVLGSQVTLDGIGQLLVPALALSAFLLLAKPFLALLMMGGMGYRKRTSFLTGLSLSQISEFSLILVALGAAAGVLPSSILTLTVLVGVITLAVSSYLILYAERLFTLLSPLLSPFERGRLKEKLEYYQEKGHDIVLVGYHEMGYHVMKSLGRMRHQTAVVDFNPATVAFMAQKGINCLYGDISDPEVLEKVRSFSPKLVVSTVPAIEDTRNLLRGLRRRGRTIFVTAREAEDATELYRLGADFVLVPDFLAGEKLSSLLEGMLGNGLEPKKDVRSKAQDAIKDYIRWLKVSSGHKHLK